MTAKTRQAHGERGMLIEESSLSFSLSSPTVLSSPPLVFPLCQHHVRGQDFYRGRSGQAQHQGQPLPRHRWQGLRLHKVHRRGVIQILISNLILLSLLCLLGTFFCPPFFVLQNTNHTLELINPNNEKLSTLVERKSCSKEPTRMRPMTLKMSVTRKRLAHSCQTCMSESLRVV